jgi:ribonuclease R
VPADPQQIVEYLRSEAGRPLKAKELARGLGIAQSDYAEFRELLARLEDEGVLYRVQRQRYAAPERINLVVGRLHTIRSGAGFVAPDAGGDDVYVSPDGLATALDGDRVIVRVERRKRGPRVEGRVVRVLERARETIVGVYHPAAGRTGGERASFGFVVPEDTRIPRDVFIAQTDAGDARDGDVVVARITHWGREHLGPAGVIESVLGRPTDPGVDVLTVIHGHGLDTDFPDDVEAEAAAIRRRGITPADLEGRRDLRDTLVFTIDPAEAKDHDDALSLVRLEDGSLEVGVHIADVAHYVREDSAIDAEALRRGTSTYLVDRVIPMLPHALSSDLCSLRPDEDRLAMSLLLRLDAGGRLHGELMVRSVVRSRHRLSYEDAQAVLDARHSIDAETDGALRTLRELSRALRQHRIERGSVDFDLPEARVVLNAAGEPTDIERVQRLEAHRLIEDFMLLANETIARRAAEAELPFVYRIHERPDDAKLEQLREFAGTFGHRLGGGTVRPKDLQRLLGSLDGLPEAVLISTVTLRSMKQARYSVENHGHFGLAARHYTHFTSPIRRYPDLMVHRLSTRYFIDRSPPERGDAAALTEIARLSSERERVAVSAERESVEMKKVEFMERHVEQEFDGTIASVTAFGFYVLLDAFYVEGLVHVSFLEDDFYVFLEDQFALVGERLRRRFRLGDRVRVRVRRVDREERQIDFDLVRHDAGRSEEPTRKERGPGRRRKGPATRGAKKAAAQPMSGKKRGKKSGKKSGRKSGSGTSGAKKVGGTGSPAKERQGARGGRRGGSPRGGRDASGRK